LPYFDTPGQLYDAPGLFYDDFQPPTTKKRMAKVKLGLKGKSIQQKLTTGQNIITAMTGNANFPAPNPTIAALQTLLTNLTNTSNGFEAGKTSQEQKKALRDAAEVAFDAGFSTESATVQSASGGDATKILSSGMQVAGAAGPVVPPGQVLNLVVTAGDNDGTLDFGVDAEPVAKSYEVEISVDPVSPTSWQKKMTVTKSSGTITGLTSGARMWVRVRAIGADPQPGPWSDPAAKTVP